ncbi:MAG: S10 family serine carboxypeptidase-like protein [Acutalibacter sp.]|jgi:carboxypeptidase C (cathepsin A)
MQIKKHSGKEFVVERQVQINGAEIRYQSVSQDWILTDSAGNEEVSFFTYSYIRTDTAEKKRPVLFAFNGGPGASCSQLHLGILGPTRIDFPDPREQRPGKFPELIPNDASPLDVCDIVMIDPPGTGYARLLDEEAAGKYLSVEGDAAAVALLIEAWLLRYDRFHSPVYIMGESYGGIRAPEVVGNLMGGPTYGGLRDVAIPVAGTITIGNTGWNVRSALYRDETLPEESVVGLPAYAAAHWYHHLSKDGTLNRDFVEEAYQFSAQEYLPALYMGQALSPEKRAHVAERLAYFTGMDPEELLKRNLRVTVKDFEKLCCAKEGKAVGIYDSRYTMPLSADAGLLDPVADDAAMGMYMPAFTALMNSEKREELGIPAGERYDQINFDVNGRFKFDVTRTPLQCLVQAMRRDPNFRVFVGSGYYDLCTLFTDIRAIVNSGKLDAARVTVKNYESGHLIYMGRENALAFGQDLREFICAGK